VKRRRPKQPSTERLAQGDRGPHNEPVEFRTLVENDYAAIDAAERVHLLRFKRTDHPIPMDTDLGPIFQAFADVLERYDTKRWAMLIDLRAAPGRNDANFETTIAKWQMSLFRRFDRTAVVVRTAAGRLQILRVASGPNASAVFLDEGQAIRHLTGSPTPAEKPKAPAS